MHENLETFIARLAGALGRAAVLDVDLAYVCASRSAPRPAKSVLDIHAGGA